MRGNAILVATVYDSQQPHRILFLLIDIPREVLQLWEFEEGRYVPVQADAEGRLWSRELGIGFAWQEDRRLVRVLRRDGTVAPTPQEEAEQRAAAEQRAEAERQRADALAAELERLRRAMGEGAAE